MDTDLPKYRVLTNSASVNSNRDDDKIILSSSQNHENLLIDPPEFNFRARLVKLMTVIFNVTNAAVGAGILSFPYAFYKTGWKLGIILTIFFAIVLGNSLGVILRTARATQAESYQDCVELMYGKKWRNILTLSIAIYTFFACVSYFLVCGALISSFFSAFSDAPFLTDQYFVTVEVAIILIPLCMLKNIDMLAPTSLIGICGVLFAVIVITGKSLNHDTTDEKFEDYNWKLSSLQSIPIICFALMCHLTAIPATSSLREYWPSSKTEGTTMWRALVTVIIASLLICCVFYIMMGYFGYKLFGDEIDEDILNNFEGDQPAEITTIKIAVATTVVFSYPVLFFVGRLALEDLYPHLKGSVKGHASVAGFFLTGTCTIAILCHAFDLDIGFVNGIIGSTAAVISQFLMPAFFFKDQGQIYFYYMYLFLSGFILIFCIFIIIAGIPCRGSDSSFCATLGFD